MHVLSLLLNLHLNHAGVSQLDFHDYFAEKLFFLYSTFQLSCAHCSIYRRSTSVAHCHFSTALNSAYVCRFFKWRLSTVAPKKLTFNFFFYQGKYISLSLARKIPIFFMTKLYVMEQIFAKIGIWACFRICRLLMNIIFVHKGNTNLFWTCFSNVFSFSWWSSFS